MKEYGGTGYILSGTANIFYERMNKGYISIEEREEIKRILPKIDKRLPEYLDKYKDQSRKAFSSD